METPSPVAAIAAIPSSTFSVSLVNAVLGMFLESSASIEEIANDNSLSIPVVMECLQEQKPFLLAMLSTLTLRVRLLSARAEAVAIESLREIAHTSRDPEARRKSASKLLSHFKRPSSPSPRPVAKRVARAACHDEGSSNTARTPKSASPRTPGVAGASPGPNALAHSHVTAEVENSSPPSPRTAGRSVIDEVDDNEGSSNVTPNVQPAS